MILRSIINKISYSLLWGKGYQVVGITYTRGQILQDTYKIIEEIEYKNYDENYSKISSYLNEKKTDYINNIKQYEMQNKTNIQENQIEEEQQDKE